MTAKKKPQTPEVAVRRVEADVHLDGWFMERLTEIVEAQFPHHYIESLQVTDFDGYGDGFVSVRVEMTK